MQVSIENLKEEFSEFDVDLQNTQAHRLQELASFYNYGADDLVNEWLAYQSQNDQCDLDNDTLEKFEKYLQKTNEKKQKKALKPQNTKMSSFDDVTPLKAKNTNAAHDVLQAYLSPELRNKLKVDQPISYNIQVKSPFSPLNSEKYSKRHNSGELIFSLMDDSCSESVSWIKKSTLTRHKAKIISKQSKKHHYMFQKIIDLSNCANDDMEVIAEDIRSQNEEEIESYHPCTNTSQTPVTIIGRFTTEENCKLTSESLCLEGDRINSNGRSVGVDVTNLDSGSIFRGQIAALTGTNPTGMKFIAHKMHTLEARGGNVSASRPSDLNKSKNLVSIMVAAGPFTTCDAMSYEPLLDLMKKVEENKPDVTMLIGPLIDENHTNVKNGEFTECFTKVSQKWISYITTKMTPFTQVVFVPSQKDVFHHPVYPQPAYKVDKLSTTDMEASLFVPDPCCLNIADCVEVGITSVDVLMHIGANEMSCGKTRIDKTDRRLRLMSHMINNQTFYPIFPAHDNLCVDWIKAEFQAKMNSLPHILIVPSDLRCFVKCHNGRIFLNPGKLSKGTGGGTYAHLLLNVENPAAGIGCAAKIVKI